MQEMLQGKKNEQLQNKLQEAQFATLSSVSSSNNRNYNNNNNNNNNNNQALFSSSDMDALQALCRCVVYLLYYIDRLWWKTSFELGAYMLIMANACAAFNGLKCL